MPGDSLLRPRTGGRFTEDVKDCAVGRHLASKRRYVLPQLPGGRNPVIADRAGIKPGY